MSAKEVKSGTDDLVAALPRRWGNVSPLHVGWRCIEGSRLDVKAMFSGVVIAIVCLPGLLTFVWFSEVLAGCFALRKEITPVAEPGTLSHRTAVLIPAHNEGAGILPTIRDVQAQLGRNDRILVGADN